MGARTRMLLGVGLIALLLPAPAQAAVGHVRLLNAGRAGAATLVVDGKALDPPVAAAAVSRRFSVASGVHTFAAARGTRPVASRTIAIRSGQRLTVVLTVAGGKPVLRLLREPGGAANATLVRVANYAGRAGAVDVRAGALTIAPALGVGDASATSRLTSAVSATGTVRVSARGTTTGTTFTASGRLVLATRSVGMFALVPTSTGARLIRLPYDLAPPTPTRLPAVTGIRRFAHTVTCGRGIWTPRPVRISRRWTVDGAIQGASATLRLSTAEDAGHVLGCAVSATSHGMTTRVRTSFRLPAVPTPSLLPAVLVPDGALQVGDQVTCDVGRWRGGASSFTFRWIRIRGGPVLGTDSTYHLSLSDNGLDNVVACVVTATNDGGRSGPAQSLNSVALDIPPTISIRTGPTRPVAAPTSFAFFTFAIGGGGADAITGAFDNDPPVQCDRFGCQVNFLFNDGPNAIPHAFTATATNPAGSASTTTWKWAVNPPLPVINGVTGPPDAATDPAPFMVDGVGGGTAGSVQCKVDKGAFSTCTGTDTTVALVEFGKPAGADGDPHTIQIRTLNAAGASRIVSFPYTFLPTPALITSVDVQPGSNSQHQPFHVVAAVAGGAVHLTCVIDGRPAVPCDPRDVLDDPGAGLHTLEVTATNARGSYTPSPVFSFTYVP